MPLFRLVSATATAALAFAFAFAGSALAATDGTSGSSSTGTSVVTIIKDDAVQITKVDDLNFQNPGLLVEDIRLADDVCVFATTTSYNVTLTSANGTGDFVLNNGNGDAIPYTVAWDDEAGTIGANGTGDTLTNGTALGSQAGNRTELDCASDAGGVNAAFAVQIAQADYNDAVFGTYTDTLTIVVAPN